MAKTEKFKRMLLIGLCGLMMAVAMTQTSFADVPYFINFQGVMTYDHDGDPATPDTTIPDGDYFVKVEIYASETATVYIWNESHAAVTAADGYMNFLIGGGTLDPHPTIPGELDWLTEDYFDGSERWLYLFIDGVGAMPRIKLTTVPYAFRVGSIGGATGGHIDGDVVVDGKVAVDEFRLKTNPTSGYVLTCDGLGNGTWQDIGTLNNHFWELDGNTGTNPPDNFLGTTDLNPLLLKVNGLRAMKLVPSDGSTADMWDNSSPSVIGGHESNRVTSGVNGGTIGGGGFNDDGMDYRNKIEGDFGTIGGGANNLAGEFGTIGGGMSNTASDRGAIPGGVGNTSSGFCSFAAGCESQAENKYSFAAGLWNHATGENSFALGTSSQTNGNYAFALGRECKANGHCSFALGKKAVAAHQGSFIWSWDDTEHYTTADDQFKVRADGGIEFHSNTGVRINCHDLTDVPATSELAVNGTIAAMEIVVTMAGWPDYVFQGDYDLRSLGHLEAEIAQNGHLPGIPSAEKIEKDGLKMGEMQRLMMEKIEELTLYVLQLNKEKQELQARIENLEQK